jgi:hypothetical protein
MRLLFLGSGILLRKSLKDFHCIHDMENICLKDLRMLERRVIELKAK